MMRSSRLSSHSPSRIAPIRTLRSLLRTHERRESPTCPGRRDSGLVVYERRELRAQCVIELLGQLDRTTSDQLNAALERALEPPTRRILLDLTGVSKMDVWGLDPILLAHLRASDQHVRFLIAPGPPSIKRVLDSIGAPFDYA